MHLPWPVVEAYKFISAQSSESQPAALKFTHGTSPRCTLATQTIRVPAGADANVTISFFEDYALLSQVHLAERIPQAGIRSTTYLELHWDTLPSAHVDLC